MGLPWWRGLGALLASIVLGVGLGACSHLVSGQKTDTSSSGSAAVSRTSSATTPSSQPASAPSQNTAPDAVSSPPSSAQPLPATGRGGALDLAAWLAVGAGVVLASWGWRQVAGARR